MSLGSLASKPLSAALFLAALAAVTLYIFVLDPAARPLIDFDVYLQAAQRLLSGDDIYSQPYTTTDRAGRSVELFYLYPPFLASALSIVTFLGRDALKLVWCALSYTAVWVAVLCLSRVLAASWLKSLSSLQRVCVVAFFTFCFEPLYVGIGDGQVTALVLSLICLCAVGLLTGSDWLVGGALALAIQIKLSPILLLLAPVMFGRWRAVGWCAAVSVALLLFTLTLGGGAQPFADFFRSVLATADEQKLADFAHNLRLSRAVLGPLGLDDSSAARFALKAAFLAATVLGTAAIRRQPGLASLRALGFLVIVMIVSAPILWFHHFAWCLVPLAILAMRPAAAGDARMRSLTIVLGLYFLLSQSYLLIHWTIKAAPELSSFAIVVPTAALLTVALLVVRQRAP